MRRSLLISLTFVVASAAAAGGCAHLQQQNHAELNLLCSDTQYAWEKGFNTGIQREELDTRWARAGCVEAAQARTIAAYTAGYREGLEKAPTVSIGVGAVPATSNVPPKCQMQSDGQNVCGYNCKTGSSGRVYCASRPDAKCALNSDGSWTCP